MFWFCIGSSVHEWRNDRRVYVSFDYLQFLVNTFQSFGGIESQTKKNKKQIQKQTPFSTIICIMRFTKASIPQINLWRLFIKRSILTTIVINAPSSHNPSSFFFCHDRIMQLFSAKIKINTMTNMSNPMRFKPHIIYWTLSSTKPHSRNVKHTYIYICIWLFFFRGIYITTVFL